MVLVFIATWISPVWPYEQALHSSLTVVGFLLLWRYCQRYPMANSDFFLIAIFFMVHCVAARWLYSNVPYEHWLQSLFGFSPQQALGWNRNHFDRLVHFLYGFCFTPAIVRHVALRISHNLRLGFIIAISAVMITSLWYAWFEWLVAIAMSAEDAESYNGQQGDMWDAQQDRLMATIGSLLWGGKYWFAQPDRAWQREVARSS